MQFRLTVKRARVNPKVNEWPRLSLIRYLEISPDRLWFENIFKVWVKGLFGFTRVPREFRFRWHQNPICFFGAWRANVKSESPMTRPASRHSIWLQNSSFFLFQAKNSINRIFPFRCLAKSIQQVFLRYWLKARRDVWRDHVTRRSMWFA